MSIVTLNNRAINRSDTASSGQVWTATSATAADFQAGGSFVKLATTTLGSGASQIDFDSTYITTDYLNYLAVFNCQPATDSVTFNFRVSTSGSFKTGASDYGHGYASDGGDANDNDRDNLNLNGTTGNATGETVSGFIYCSTYF